MLPKFLPDPYAAKFFEAWDAAIHGENAHPRVEALHKAFTQSAGVPFVSQAHSLVCCMIDETEREQGATALEAVDIVHAALCGPKVLAP